MCCLRSFVFNLFALVAAPPDVLEPAYECVCVMSDLLESELLITLFCTGFVLVLDSELSTVILLSPSSFVLSLALIKPALLCVAAVWVWLISANMLLHHSFSFSTKRIAPSSLKTLILLMKTTRLLCRYLCNLNCAG